MVYWIVGMSGSGKTTLANEVYSQLKSQHPECVIVDGDVIRQLFDHDQVCENIDPYSIEERAKNADRICKLCRWLDSQGIHVVCAILSIFEDSRQWNRKNLSQYFEVYLRADVSYLEEHRDYKGIYANARSGSMKNVVGLDISFEEPMQADIVLDVPLVERMAIRDVANEILKQSGVEKF